MEPWIDTHFVKVQDRPKGGVNKVTFGGETFSESGYLSYSATGTAQVRISAFFPPSTFLISPNTNEFTLSILVSQGAVLYAYYGREDDLTNLQDLNIDMNGRVLLVRAGKNSYAEKVGGKFLLRGGGGVTNLIPVSVINQTVCHPSFKNGRLLMLPR